MQKKFNQYIQDCTNEQIEKIKKLHKSIQVAQQEFSRYGGIVNSSKLAEFGAKLLKALPEEYHLTYTDKLKYDTLYPQTDDFYYKKEKKWILPFQIFYSRLERR